MSGNAEQAFDQFVVAVCFILIAFYLSGRKQKPGPQVFLPISSPRPGTNPESPVQEDEPHEIWHPALTEQPPEETAHLLSTERELEPPPLESDLLSEFQRGFAAARAAFGVEEKDRKLREARKEIKELKKQIREMATES